MGKVIANAVSSGKGSPRLQRSFFSQGCHCATDQHWKNCKANPDVIVFIPVKTGKSYDRLAATKKDVRPVGHQRRTYLLQKKNTRKEYICRVCNEAMVGTGHTQFCGKRYCPNAPGQITKEEWLALRKAEAEAPMQNGI
ncbi:uncharacterized protein LOC144654074 [Oculina patagonica]